MVAVKGLNFAKLENFKFYLEILTKITALYNLFIFEVMGNTNAIKIFFPCISTGMLDK